jgi:hypothetical protein
MTRLRAGPRAAQSFNWLALIAALTVCCHASPLWAMEETLVVTIDQARVVKLPPATETLIVGNAAMQRGLDRQSYSCAPQCLPTAKLGDDIKYFGDVSGQVKDHNAQATGLQ